MPAPVPQTSAASLTARAVSVERGSRTILRDISLTIGPRTRLGVVGPNGVGKSTLLRVLAGIEPFDGGQVELRPPSAIVGYLAQERHRDQETVRDLLHRRTGVAEADRELLDASSGLADAGAGAGGEAAAGDRYAAALERWMSLGAADLDARINVILDEVGLPARVLTQQTDELSGGQIARAELAMVLLSRFDLTLLDEPTNDLDFDGLARLEAFVAGRAGGLMIVSHDRAFLDRTITSVLELDEHDGTGRLFEGGYGAYLEERQTARRHAEEAFETYQSQRETLQQRAQRERQWASGVSKEKKHPRDNDKAQRDFRINRTERLAARARMTERAFDRLEVIDKPWEGWDLRFSIDEAPRAGAIAARLEQAVIQRGDFRIGPLDLEIAWAERVAITGPNGSGKTTVLDALLGRLPLTSGQRYLGPSIVVGELGQARTAFVGGAETLLDAFLAFGGQTLAEARSLLAKFGLGSDQVQRPASTLSPGERTRAELAAFQAVRVNLLVLDEPTNHLDLPAIEQLEQALAGFSGTVVLVTHDRRLLETVELDRHIDLGQAAR